MKNKKHDFIYSGHPFVNNKRTKTTWKDMILIFLTLAMILVPFLYVAHKFAEYHTY